MKNLFDFYTIEKNKYQKQLDSLNSKIRRSSTMRVFCFVLTLIIAYMSSGETMVLTGVLVLGLLVFILLILKHEQLNRQKKLTAHLVDINDLELNCLDRNFESRNTGGEFIDRQHYFSNDIDLFGPGSFFQYMNRCSTYSGKKKLASLLGQNDIESIQDKQASIKELEGMVEWRQRFLAFGKMVEVQVDHTTIINWLKAYVSFLPIWMNWLTRVFSVFSIIGIILTTFQVIPFSVLLIWFFIGLAISLMYLKKINLLYNSASQTKMTFKQYHQLLDQIENIDLSSDQMVRAKKNMLVDDEKASLILKYFSDTINAFDQRNNMLFGALGNGFLLWDLHQGQKIEKWINTYHAQVEKWFDLIAFFDAQISMANYAFNHPEHSYPKISDDGHLIKAKSIGHPLISASSRVNNDFEIGHNDFMVITGANMAGKSTFLRTVSLNLMMANCGLPVCAESFVYRPVKLISSMRTTDSLLEESSYFHAEIKRLQFIINKIDKDHYFIVLDEILKGTNSKDKAIGSRKFLEKLLGSGSTGIIATHDLSLCEIENDQPRVHNKHFDAMIKNDQLYFDYKLQNGVCENMNASFLLKKMGII